MISSKAGTGKGDMFFEKVVRPVLDGVGLGRDGYQVLQTKDAASVYDFGHERVRQKAVKGVEQTVVLLSGDGGVGDLLNGVAGVERMRYVFPFVFFIIVYTNGFTAPSSNQPSSSSPSAQATPSTTPSTLPPPRPQPPNLTP